jgi:hypothetical protein
LRIKIETTTGGLSKTRELGFATMVLVLLEQLVLVLGAMVLVLLGISTMIAHKGN